MGDSLSRERTLGGKDGKDGEAPRADVDAISRERTVGASEEGGWALSPGDRIAGYEVLERLGRGGMGEVYLVRHVELGRRYALKLVRPALATSPGFVERFRREARVTANLEHPNILHADDSGEDAGRFWFRMEYMEGVEAGAFIERASVEGAPSRATSLADLMRAAGGRLHGGLVADILGEALDGLAFAHSRGVVHRDLKPSNILLTEGDDRGPVAKIGDFGLVKVVGEERVRSMAGASMQTDMSAEATDGAVPPKTGEGAADAEPDDLALSLVGTYEYMAPEQKRGEPTDARSDVYAMGLVAYRMLTGRQGLSLDLPSEVAKEIDPGWDKFVRKALAEEPKRRFADAGEMLGGLREFRERIRPPLSTTRRGRAARTDKRAPLWFSYAAREHSRDREGEGMQGGLRKPNPKFILAIVFGLAGLGVLAFIVELARGIIRDLRSSPKRKGVVSRTVRPPTPGQAGWSTHWRAEGEKRGREWAVRMEARNKAFTGDEARRVAKMMTSDYAKEGIDDEGGKRFVEGFMNVALLGADE